MKLHKVSVALLVIQLVLVSSIAVRYLVQRVLSPRVWTRVQADHSSLLMRGRYLSLHLTVDGCHSTLPNARLATFPRNVDGTTKAGAFSIHSSVPVRFPSRLKVQGNTLTAIRLQNPDSEPGGVMVEALPESSCAEMRVSQPVDFYVAGHAAIPAVLQPGQELWVEVTVPSDGPPHPIQLALKEGGAWKPLAFQ